MSGALRLALVALLSTGVSSWSRAVQAADKTQPGGAVPGAPPSERSSLEGFAAIGPSVVAGEPANAETRSFRRVGGYGEIGLAFRSRYFLDPFVSVGYGMLAAGETPLPDGEWGDGGTMHQHLDIWLISPGITADLWRLRLRLGLGLAVVVQRDTFHGEDNSATQLPIAHQFGVGFNVYDRPRFRLDAEAKLVTAAGAGVTFGALGVTARGDLIQF